LTCLALLTWLAGLVDMAGFICCWLRPPHPAPPKLAITCSPLPLILFTMIPYNLSICYIMPHLVPVPVPGRGASPPAPPQTSHHMLY
jgi:hypothetical protein